MNKEKLKSLKRNEEIFSALAEKRAIEILGLTDKELNVVKAFETTKAVELINIKNIALNRNHRRIQQLTFRSVFSWKF